MVLSLKVYPELESENRVVGDRPTGTGADDVLQGWLDVGEAVELDAVVNLKDSLIRPRITPTALIQLLRIKTVRAVSKGNTNLIVVAMGDEASVYQPRRTLRMG